MLRWFSAWLFVSASLIGGNPSYYPLPALLFLCYDLAKLLPYLPAGAVPSSPCGCIAMRSEPVGIERMEDEYYLARASSSLLSLVFSPPRPRETAAAATISIVLRQGNRYCNAVQCGLAQGEARQRLGIIPSIPPSSSPIATTPERIPPLSPPSPPFIPTSSSSS
ncbi:hypothetical protein BDP55DRAFT_631695 [Colletotrichum godetiae]|uniref:Secreted protein n=1 Tax=Colletotrichum godetiae TaxID=1209918 RepID=A0AAJ0EY94_9PEZI|nr:uncharacterized protein BDP55DRAFT_631695 [Colletotrichum godetiae]KAK1676000.1 hypothetical protein BDP55DRAFT_631695 [Colletotrichum godetiae]